MLISESEIVSVKPLGRNVQGVNMLIENAELELRKLVGRDFYSFILDTDDTTLLHGDSNQKGFKRLLIELFWIELLKDESIHMTASGVVQKKTEDSQQISEDVRRRQIRLSRKRAFEIFKDIAFYLNDNKDAYPDYNKNKLVDIFSTIKTTLI